MSARSRRRHRRTSRKRNPALSTIVVLGAGFLGVFLFVGLYAMGIASSAPAADALRPVDQGANSVVLAADGSRLGYIQSDEARTPVGADAMTHFLRDATVAIEDERFYHHAGVDVQGVARAAVANLQAGAVREGGSTITMQLARNLFIDNPGRNLERKIKEAKIAEELEAKHSKRWILTQYLNTASYGTVNGRTAVGVEAAADFYFSKSAAELTLPQAALIAGLPQAPSLYNPLLNPPAALERRNEVIDEMRKQGYVSEDQAAEAMQTPIKLKPGKKYETVREPYFFDYVEQQLIDRYGVNTVRQGGLVIRSTIDPGLQTAAKDAIDSALYYSTDPSAAAVTIDPATGYIKAMASSGQYADRQFNLAAQGHRQPGSSFKTMALTTAIREGIDPNSTYYTSQPLNIDDPVYGPWEVATYSNSYAGSISLHDATLASDNTVYAQLALDIGPENIAQTAHDMGIKTQLDGLPAETLGGLRLGVSPLEMATAYATLADGGVRNEPLAIRSVRFPGGRIDRLGKPQRTRAFSDGVAYEVTNVLKDNVDGGTGVAANAAGCSDIAGKTGTTDDYTDAWFVGYTPNYSTAVWVGYPDALQSMSSVHGITVAGGTFPAEIWGSYMATALGGNCETFPEPTNPVEWVDFEGKYESAAGDTCAGAATTGSGISEGIYSCQTEEKKKKKKNGGAYAPDTSKPKPKPPKPPDPPDPDDPPDPPDDGGGGGGGGVGL